MRAVTPSPKRSPNSSTNPAAAPPRTTGRTNHGSGLGR
jgi:hypothetical protein